MSLGVIYGTAIALLAVAPLGALNAAKPLASFQRQTWDTENGLPQNTVHAMLETRDGYLWLATEGGLARFDGVKITVFDSQNTPALRSNNIRALWEDGAGALWIGTADGLTVFRGGETQVFTREQGLASNSVWSIAGDAQGYVVVTTAGGAAEFRDGRFVARGAKAAAGPGNGPALKDSQGAVWTGDAGGVTRTANGHAETLAIGGEAVLSLLEDREGDVWIGSESNGVTVLRDPKFTTYTTDFTRCVYQDRQGALWFGTNGGLTKMAGGRFSRFTAADGLSSDLVFAIGETASGDLLAGTQDGLNVIHNGKVKVLTTADGLPDDLIRSLHTDADGAVWIGTRRGLTVWRDGRFRTYTQADGLASDFSGALTRGRDGALWVGTLRGLTRMKDGRFETFLAGRVVTAVYEDAAGVLWIGTEDGGLWRRQNGNILPYAGAGLPNSIYAIVEDGGFLWLASKTGIFRVAGASIAQYGTADGMRVNECSAGGHPAAWRARDGGLWFATLGGVATIDARAAAAKGAAPPVAIESFSVDDQGVTARAAKEIAPGHERLSFEYTGISFASPQKVRFRYRLEGFDGDWVEAGTRRTAYYTSLGPGWYRFRVMARANDGDWSGAEASIAFRLLPHFYQTVWFYLALGAALAGSVFAVYRWRVQQVEAQFAAVLAERSRIAREIHDTLAQGFVAVSLQLELLGRQLENAPAGVKDLVKQARAMVQSSLEEARRSIWELRSTGDLRGRLSQMAAEAAERSGMKVQFQVRGAYRVLPEKIESELLKIGQEAVTNAVRHAQAREVKIDLAYEGKTLRLTVADDGRGFEGEANASGPEGHYGLRGMRERAAQIGAELTVRSRPGHGTEIDVEKMVP